MTYPARPKGVRRVSGLVLAAAVGAAGALAGSALLVHGDGASAAQPAAHAAVATAASGPRTDDYLFARFAASDSWTYYKSEAKDFGLSRLYVMDSNGPFKFGPRDSVWNIGTYGRRCLVTIGYANIYSEAGLHGASKLNVEVFNRYGRSTYTDGYNSISYKAVKAFVAKSAKHCK